MLRPSDEPLSRAFVRAAARSRAAGRMAGRAWRLAWWAAALAILLPAAGRAVPTSSTWIARVWQASDGLADNRVTSVAQAADGYLWIGTYGKLLRFNGTTFEPRHVSAIRGVIGYGARAIFVDRTGAMWISGIREQLVRVGPTSAQVFDGASGVPNATLSGFAQGTDGTTWLLFGTQVVRVEGPRLVPSDFASVPDNGLGSASLTADIDGRVWCALGRQVGLIEGRRFEPQFEREAPVLLAPAKHGGVWVCSGGVVAHAGAGHAPEAALHLPDEVKPTLMLEDSSGNLWIGTRDRGLFRAQGGKLEWVEISHLQISCLLEDREGDVWAGTMGGGLNRLRRRSVNVIGPRLAPPFESVTSVALDAKGAAWAVTGSGRVFRLGTEGWELARFVDPDVSTVTELAFDVAGGLWLGTQRHGLHHVRDADLSNPSAYSHFVSGSAVRALFPAADGAMWCAADGTARVIRVQAGAIADIALPRGTRVVRCFAQSADGAVWAGTTDGKVLRYDGARLHEVPAIASAGAYSVRCLHATPDGSLWIGYADQGIGWFRDGKYTRLTVEDGLMDTAVYQIASDLLGGLWVASPKGVYHLKIDDVRRKVLGRAGKIPCRLVGRDEGLPNAQVHYDHSPATGLTRTGNILFATGIGVVALNPSPVLRTLKPPPVVIESFSLDEKLIAVRGSRSPLFIRSSVPLDDLAGMAAVRVPPGHHRVEVDFAALSYADNENVRFRYRLEGFDPGWLEARTERSAQYSRLPPGRYTLRVIATNDDGVWTEEGAALGIVVDPFVWQTWWFRASALGAFTLLVVAVVRLVSFQRLRAQLRVAEQKAAVLQERTRIARDIHDDLGGTLTHIKLLSELATQDSAEPARTRLRQITNSARQMLKSLDETIWAINPRNDRLPDLISYSGQYAIEFLQAAGLTCELDLPDAPGDVPVRSELRHHVFLVVKEALTNVVKHAQARKVVVRVSVAGAKLELQINDDGKGFAAGVNSPFADGIENMRQRMLAVGGELRVHTQPGVGTQIELTVDLT